MDEKQLSIDIVGLAGAYSYALDCIEAELVNITNKHGKRVAYMSVCMAKYWNVENDALQDLAICALLHDNALTQYITEEVKKNPGIDIGEDFLNEKANLPKNLEIGIFTQPHALLISVDDTGTGITPENRTAIFDNGFSTKGKNRGTGLFIVKNLVQKYGGEISVESETDTGTAFTVTLTEEGGNQNV